MMAAAPSMTAVGVPTSVIATGSETEAEIETETTAVAAAAAGTTAAGTGTEGGRVIGAGTEGGRAIVAAAIVAAAAGLSEAEGWMLRCVGANSRRLYPTVGETDRSLHTQAGPWANDSF